MAGNPIPETGKVYEVLVIALAGFQFFIFLSGFFVRAFFKRLEDDIKKLFDFHDERFKDCRNHGEKISYLEAKINGRGK